MTQTLAVRQQLLYGEQSVSCLVGFIQIYVHLNHNIDKQVSINYITV